MVLFLSITKPGIEQQGAITEKEPSSRKKGKRGEEQQGKSQESAVKSGCFPKLPNIDHWWETDKVGKKARTEKGLRELKRVGVK